jgi:amidophosphoribosyltransferase
MCGIVGLYLKDSALNARLGELFEPMLIEMTQRGPDSSGFAVYRNPAPEGEIKAVLQHPDLAFDWAWLAAKLMDRFKVDVDFKRVHSHCLVVLAAKEVELRAEIAALVPEVNVVSVGRYIEIYKEVGLPEEVAAFFDLKAMGGTHAIGHTRMATESAVTTAGSHPFSTGSDLCLVHNGSLSNHNRLRRNLERYGSVFRTENDTEVAANYFDWKLQQGLSLEDALYAGIEDLDGFYTFCIGRSDGFAVLRDPIACKPAVMAETEQWVAMASEYRALAHLPGVESARLWEPEPATVYVWEGHKAAGTYRRPLQRAS